eukprot:gene10474-11571_t
MSQAACEVKENMTNPTDIVDTRVAIDGTWQKRGKSSLRMSRGQKVSILYALCLGRGEKPTTLGRAKEDQRKPGKLRTMKMILGFRMNQKPRNSTKLKKRNLKKQEAAHLGDEEEEKEKGNETLRSKRLEGSQTKPRILNSGSDQETGFLESQQHSNEMLIHEYQRLLRSLSDPALHPVSCIVCPTGHEIAVACGGTENTICKECKNVSPKSFGGKSDEKQITFNLKIDSKIHLARRLLEEKNADLQKSRLST